MLYNEIIAYFNNFVEEHGSSDMMEAWEEAQGEFKEKFFKKLKPKKAHKPKDAPKGARSAYIFFGIQNRELIKEENPNFDTKEIMREQGRRWKALSDEDKEEYEEMAKEDKVRYTEEMENYVPSESSEEKGKKKRAKKDPNAPKGAKNAYIFYCAANRDILKEENPEMTGKEIVSLMAKNWKELKENDPDEASKYEEMAAEDKERYNEENEKYMEENGIEKPEKKTKAIAKKKETKKPAVKKETKKPAKETKKSAAKPVKETKKPATKKEVKKPAAKKQVAKKVAYESENESESNSEYESDDE